jgi:hypothetical protein
MALQTMTTLYPAGDVHKTENRTRARGLHDAFGWSRSATWWVLAVGIAQAVEVLVRIGGR